MILARLLGHEQFRDVESGLLLQKQLFEGASIVGSLKSYTRKINNSHSHRP